MKTLFFAGTLLLAAGLMDAQAQRNVNWIHGLGGNGGSWQPFADDFYNQRQILMNTHESYNTGDGVGGMVQDIQNHIGAGTDPTGIAITHSMGGVATRQIDVQNNGRFGGVITFGAPLRGARVANNVNNGVANDYVANAVYQLRKGPFRSLFSIPQVILAYYGIKDIDNFVGDMVVQEVRNSLSLTPTTANDLAEESGYNQAFYGNSTGTPKLVYWGNEASPIHIRLFAGSANIDEEATINEFNNVRQIYGTVRDVNYTLRWTFPLLFPYFNWLGDGWADGYDYLAGQSENEWSNLIGAGYTVTQQVTNYEFVGNNFYDYEDCVNNANGDLNQIQICDNTYFQWVTRDVQVFIRDQSDGLVPRQSQVGEGTAWTGNAEIYELPGNSHNEMRRSDQSKDELNQAFDGNRGDRNFFIPTR